MLFNLDKLRLLQYIDNSIIGKNYVINGPWGPRKCKIIDLFSITYAYQNIFLVIYADYTASGRSLWFIENYIQQYVIPL